MRTHDRNIEMTGILRLGGDRIAALCFIAIIGVSLPAVTWAAVINRGLEGPPLSKIRPAPKSIYPDQEVITAQPSPSEVDPAYLGPVLLMSQLSSTLTLAQRPCLCGKGGWSQANWSGRL
jgi:hypothetical protein